MLSNKSQCGITLVEVIVGLAIFALLMVGLYSLINLSTKVLADNRARVDATALANQRLEMIRNLAYADVGTIGGIPSGNIPQNEQITLNRITYSLSTNIQYLDDPFDGTAGGNPPDFNGADYKRVRVEVTWPNMLINHPVVFLSDVAPKGLETALSGGTLVFTVFDAQAQPVSSASVHIENTDVDPDININTVTQANGRLILPGMPPSVETYDVTVTKNGYSTDRTYEVDPVNNPNPSPPPLSIYENIITEESFEIDRLSTLVIRTFTEEGQPQPNLAFNLHGSKIIGTDQFEDPIYKYNQNLSTDGNGVLTLSNMEWDTYEFQIDHVATGLDIAGANLPLPINLAPNTNQTVDIYFAPHTDHTLLLTVRNDQNQLVPDASVHLTRVLPPHDETKITSAWGQAFFSNLVQGEYTLDIQAAGYQNYNMVMLVDGQTTANVSLMPL